MDRRVPTTALVLLVAAAVAGAGQAPDPAAQQPPTFKLEVNYVEVDALVTDSQGRFVRDLKKDDFHVLEDGKPQTIANFSLVDIPIERARRPLFASRPIEPDVQSNERPFDGRVYVMVLDDLHTAVQRTPLVKRAAREFIEQRLGANDLMAIVTTSGTSDTAQEFTANKRLLLAAVDKMMGRKLPTATAGRTEQYYSTLGSTRSPGDPLNDMNDPERAYNARTSLAALRNVAEWFGAVHGRRKSILFVSEGIDYNVYDMFGTAQPATSSNGPINNMQGANASDIMDETRRLIATATQANVSIYGIDPRGLTSLGGDDIEIQAYPDDPTLGIGPGSLRDELRVAQDSLRVMSEQTGGFAVVDRNDFGTAFDRIVRDNSSYYVLAYYPPGDKRDGKVHRIDVRVDRPGLTVRARKGYAAPKGKAPAARPAAAGGTGPEVREALNSPLPISGLGMKVFAAPFRGAAPNASVLIGAELAGRDLQLGPNDRVELSFIALDREGKIRGGKTDAMTLNLKPATKARIQADGLRLLNRVDLPPGRYQLRVAAHDSSGGSIGSVQYDLEVPDFDKPPLAMSGLVLTSAIAQGEMTARPDETLRDILPGPPVAMREFPHNDEIALFAEVYDNQPAKGHKVDITTTVTSDEGKVLFKNEDARDSAELQGKKGGYGYTTRLAMDQFPQGPYVLKVEARSTLGEGPAASREVQFTVGPPRAVGPSR